MNWFSNEKLVAFGSPDSDSKDENRDGFPEG